MASTIFNVIQTIFSPLGLTLSRSGKAKQQHPPRRNILGPAGARGIQV